MNNRFLTSFRFFVPTTLLVVGLILNGYAFVKFLTKKRATVTPSPSVAPTVLVSPAPKKTVSPSPPPPAIAPSIEPKSVLTLKKTKLGHFPYQEGDVQKMVVVASYATGAEYQRFEKLAPEAAFALMKMIYAARDEGVWIVPVSGFRTIADQKQLFQYQIQRQGSPEKAAKLSAPPGYSEHHTGFAIDLTDGNFPKKDITYEFAETKAFQWLIKNANQYGFEMSFPENNSQGVSYEPWHWRFFKYDGFR
ncbi:M15 family metallopeptidase [Okeania hirsuta]|uniref:D-alanyl-D-alanine carboxypeptidase family protein n=1 Tax=Okeania hirsuta TaxID=1458930 RepID=A0A3N6N463_9CYAN|nr:M15 family metallopeptidase [Okeania hirsuta]RQH10859.1 D-alanyl-D-alanine carboxypeptidase family protein [Okeania hirsuta]RQH34472.1 D-alanyl-D-alanine carboxypeptidase family protein [Okeania hirsuta]